METRTHNDMKAIFHNDDNIKNVLPCWFTSYSVMYHGLIQGAGKINHLPFSVTINKEEDTITVRLPYGWNQVYTVGEYDEMGMPLPNFIMHKVSQNGEYISLINKDNKFNPNTWSRKR